MSDYLYCVSNPDRPDLIKIMSGRDDPRIDSRNPYRTQRKVGHYDLEWTLRVVNRTLSEAALNHALRRYRDRSFKGFYACDPMTARGEAVALTTIRPNDPRARKFMRRSLLGRLLPFRRKRAA